MPPTRRTGRNDTSSKDDIGELMAGPRGPLVIETPPPSRVACVSAGRRRRAADTAKTGAGDAERYRGAGVGTHVGQA